jgi:hypothetical protein
MAETITLHMPDRLFQKVRRAATIIHQQPEDMLIAWIERSVMEPPVECLPDDQILDLCDLQMDDSQQNLLEELLGQQREGPLDRVRRQQLDELMHVYRRGLVRKAQAWKAAVERGLKAPSN